ncbi:MAG: hypothetical protein L5655_07180 [Thermosediminibacteraceae bacterium]|nr:hypothetical protein [Thermosediminibacteraceae bacterium]
MLGKKNSGFALVSTFFVISLLFLVGIIVLDMMTAELKKTAYFRDSAVSYYLAEAGIQKSLAALKKDPNYSPGGGENLGDGVFEVFVEKISPHKLKVTSQGRAGRARDTISVVVEIFGGEKGTEIKVISWERQGKEEI